MTSQGRAGGAEDDDFFASYSPSEEEGAFGGLWSSEWDQWARYGRLDAKGLTKALPDEVVMALREGRIDPLTFARCLCRKQQSRARMMVAELPCAAGISLMSAETMDEALQYLLGTHILGCEGREDEFFRLMQGPNKTVSMAIMMDFLKKMKFHVWNALASGRTGNDHTFDDRYFVNYGEVSPDYYRVTHYYTVLHVAFDKTCPEFESRVKNLTGRSIAENTDMYKATNVDFDSTLDEWLRDMVDTGSPQYIAYFEDTKKANQRFCHILSAASNLAEGCDSLQKMCWECNTVETTGKGKVMVCGGCKAARYCCKDHQRRAWRDGHRNSCATLKILFQSLQDNLKSFDKRYEANDIILREQGQSDGNGGGGGGDEDSNDDDVRPLPPCAKVDMRVLNHIQVIEEVFLLGQTRLAATPVFEIVRNTCPSLPTMKQYYTNMANVWKGHDYSFLFSDTPNSTLQQQADDEEIVAATRAALVNVRMDDLDRVSRCIGFSRPSTREQDEALHRLSKLKNHHGDADGRDDFRNANEFFAYVFNGQEQERGTRGEPFRTAQELFLFYQLAGPGREEKENRRKEYRNEAYNDIMGHFREDLHKLPQKP